MGIKGKKERFLIQSKIQIGINSYFFSGRSSILYYNDPTSLEQREIMETGTIYGSGLSFLLSVGVGHKFNERIGCFANLEYCTTSYNFTFPYKYAEIDNSTVYYYEEGNKEFSSSVSWLNLNAGIYFSIIKSKS